MSAVQTLYQDENYFILSYAEGSLIGLGFAIKGITIEFTLDEWKNVRDMFACIKIAPPRSTETILFKSKTDRIVARAKSIDWIMKFRMLTVGFPYEDFQSLQRILLKKADIGLIKQGNLDAN